MFKIEAYVEDKRVGDALRALAGIVRGMPSCVPMVNVQEHPQTKKLTAKSGGSMLEMLEKHLLENKVEKLTPDDVRAFVKTCGRSPASAVYLVGLAVKARLIKRIGKSSNTTYQVVKRLAHG